MDVSSPQDDARKPSLLARIAATLVMSSIVACVTLQVISRYVAHIQIAWTEEAARLLLLWVTVVGAILAVASRSHFRMDVVAARLPGPARRWLDLAVAVLSTLFLMAFFYSGVLFSLDMADARSQLLGIYYGVPYSAVPAAAGGMLVALWLRIRADRKG